MNTNSNVYTVVYTTIIVAVVAAILAWAAMGLKEKQDANIKAETISQMLSAAQISTKDDLAKIGNDKILDMYASTVKEAYLVNSKGEKTGELSIDRKNLQLADGLKAQDRNIKNNPDAEQLPVYVFEKDGKRVNVIPIYGAGLWGPIWGYIALEDDLKTVVGAYFDHESETPGLGAKIKDDPKFRALFQGKKLDLSSDTPLSVVKGGAKGDSQVDAISGATMTCKGLSAAFKTWLTAYKPFLEKPKAQASAPVAEPAADKTEEK